jgi:RNA polymerase sigma-54 factor
MSTNLSQTTSQRQVLQQRLILTQELQLFLKLIQMNTLELKDYLEEQLIENPTLEEPEVPEEKSESDSLDEEINFDNFTDNRLLKDRNDDLPHSASREFFDDSEEDTTWENRVSSADSLADHLSWQLKVSDFSDEERQIASIIIGNTNEDGYLETDISEIGREVLQEKGIAVKSDDAVDALNQDSGLTGLIHSVLCRIQ